MLSPGTAVCWKAARHQTRLRGRIVAHIEAGSAPAQVAPELIGLKTTQVRFSNPRQPRQQAHYLIRREERNERGMDQCVYYLPAAGLVEPVREKQEQAS